MADPRPKYERPKFASLSAERDTLVTQVGILEGQVRELEAELDARALIRQQDEEEKRRLSALVARMREWISIDPQVSCRRTVAYYHEREEILADVDGQRAAEELRLLRAWEAAALANYDAHDRCPETKEEEDRQEAATVREEEARASLVEFREREKGATS